MKYNKAKFLDKNAVNDLLNFEFSYSERVIHIEDGDDQKIHIKMLIHPSRTSLVSDYVSLITQFLSKSNLETGYDVDLESDVVIDFYQIGNWNKHGKYENHMMEYIR